MMRMVREWIWRCMKCNAKQGPARPSHCYRCGGTRFH